MRNKKYSFLLLFVFAFVSCGDNIFNSLEKEPSDLEKAQEELNNGNEDLSIEYILKSLSEEQKNLLQNIDQSESNKEDIYKKIKDLFSDTDQQKLNVLANAYRDKSGADIFVVLKGITKSNDQSLNLVNKECGEEEDFFNEIMIDLAFTQSASIYLQLSQALLTHKFCDNIVNNSVCTKLNKSIDSSLALQSLIDDILFNLSVIKPLKGKAVISEQDISDKECDNLYQHFLAMETALDILIKNPDKTASADNYKKVKDKISQLKVRLELSEAEKNSEKYKDKTPDQQKGIKIRSWIQDFTSCT